MTFGAVEYVLIGFSLFICLWIFSLTAFWKTWNGISRYFTIVQNQPWETLSALGWPAPHPNTLVLKGLDFFERTRNGLKLRRLHLRLLIWGSPPILNAPEEAIRALNRFRLWTVLAGAPAIVIGLFMSTLVLEVLYFMILIFAITCIYIIAYRPTPWHNQI